MDWPKSKSTCQLLTRKSCPQQTRQGAFGRKSDIPPAISVPKKETTHTFPINPARVVKSACSSWSSEGSASGCRASEHLFPVCKWPQNPAFQKNLFELCPSHSSFLRAASLCSHFFQSRCGGRRRDCSVAACHPLLNLFLTPRCCLGTKLCPTLCNPIDCSLPGSSVHGIF